LSGLFPITHGFSFLRRDAGKAYIYTDEYRDQLLESILEEQPLHDAAKEYMTEQDPDEYRYTPLQIPESEAGAEAAPGPQPGREEGPLSQALGRVYGGETPFSGLSGSEAQQVAEAFGIQESSLAAFQDEGIAPDQAVLYAQLAESFDLSAEEILAQNLDAKGAVALYGEMYAYQGFLHEDWRETETDALFRAYLLQGLPFERLKTAYTIHRTVRRDVRLSGLPARGLAGNRDRRAFPRIPPSGPAF